MKAAAFALLSLAVGLLGFMAKPEAQRAVSFERSTLVIAGNSDGKPVRHRFDVELAKTGEQHSYGLMFRRSLPANAGMLFDYGAPQHVLMWMRNTFIPLDMLFVAVDGRITRIVQRTVPQSLENIESKGKVRAVLEVNGGTVQRLGIKPGDRVLHGIFGNTGG